MTSITTPTAPRLTAGAAYLRVALLVLGTFGVQTVSALERAGLPVLPHGWDHWQVNWPALSVLLGLTVLAGVLIARLRRWAVAPVVFLLLPTLAFALEEHTDGLAALSAGLWAAVSLWLTIELMRGHARPTVRRIPAWRAGLLALGVKAAALPAGGFVALLLTLLSLSWGNGLGITPENAPLKYPVRTVAAGVEEIVLVAGVAVILMAARRPVWEIYAAAIIARVLPHLYEMPTAVSAAALAAGAVFFYLRYGRVWPLVTAHAIGNLIASYGGRAGALPLIGLGAATLIVAAWTLVWRTRHQPFSIRAALSYVAQPLPPGQAAA